MNCNIESTPSFTFSLPSDFQRIPARGIDSYVATYTNEDLYVGLDEGAYGKRNFDMESSFPRFRSHNERIGGMDVQIASFEQQFKTYPYTIAATFAQGQLVIWVDCRTEENYKIAMEIFRSVRMKPQNC